MKGPRSLDDQIRAVENNIKKVEQVESEIKDAKNAGEKDLENQLRDEKQLRKEEDLLREAKLALLKRKGNVELTLRPWIGYGEVPLRHVRVSSFDELMKEARALVGCNEGTRVKLYFCELNDAGLPIDIRDRVMISGFESMQMAKEKGGGIVWVYVGDRHASGPQKQKYCSPFLVDQLVGFADLPELYDDDALTSLMDHFKSQYQDPWIVFMMAMPGSGKSRTVMSACQGTGYLQVRIKFHELQLDVIRSCIRNVKVSMTYQDWRSELFNVIKGLLDEKLGSIKGPCVIHIDEAQTLMGTSVVSRKEWDDEKNTNKDPWNLVMPTLCSILNGYLIDFPDRRCVITGTNFFAPLAVGHGAAINSTHIVIDGTFPPEWVMSKLVNKYFRIPKDLMGEMLEHVTFLSGNRRAIQHFLTELRLAVLKKRVEDTFSAKELRKAREKAFSDWSPHFKSLERETETCCSSCHGCACFS